VNSRRVPNIPKLMKPFCWTVILSLFAAIFPSRAEEAGPVVVVPIRTEISAAQFFFLRRALKDAERRKASALILDMETYGGEVKAAIDSMDALLKTKVPTYTYINNKAISAGALIAIATQKIYMAPTGVIGAAAPVMAGGEDLAKTMKDKSVSMLSAVARAASQKNGHNPDIAEAFIYKEKELKIGGVVIDDADSLLTLSAEEAATYYDGKPLLAAGVAASLDELLNQAGLTAKVERLEPSGFEQIAFWVTALSPLLLLGGIIGAYIEMKVPGFGIAGAVSLACFALFFAGHYIAGLSGWEVAACFIIGLALVLGELLLHPGTIIPGLLGALLMLGAVVWAMIDRYPSQPLWPSEDMLVRPLTNLSIAIIAAGVIIAILIQYLPKSPLYRHLALVTTQPSGGSVAVPESARGISAGMSGHAKTTLRPSGKADFNGQIFDVVSEGEFIEAGQPIRVVAVEGARVVVEAG
jgi:membrane-bound serine protease (ClpP class)